MSSFMVERSSWAGLTGWWAFAKRILLFDLKILGDNLLDARLFYPGLGCVYTDILFRLTAINLRGQREQTIIFRHVFTVTSCISSHTTEMESRLRKSDSEGTVAGYFGLGMRDILLSTT